MRVNPVTSAGRSNVRRKRPSLGETESERQASGFSAHLPAPQQPVLERDQTAFSSRYLPNSVFLAHLIATRDGDIQTRALRQTASLNGANTYRDTASLPRRRAAGHLFKTER